MHNRGPVFSESQKEVLDQITHDLFILVRAMSDPRSFGGTRGADSLRRTLDQLTVSQTADWPPPAETFIATLQSAAAQMRIYQQRDATNSEHLTGHYKKGRQVRAQLFDTACQHIQQFVESRRAMTAPRSVNYPPGYPGQPAAQSRLRQRAQPFERAQS
jgi:hypothetical protein